MPPGPLPLPIFGNIFDLPRIKPWEVYRELSVKYGSELLFMDLPNQPTIVLNSTNSILALMEGHAKTYSSKAEAVMDEMTGWDWNLALTPYNQRWRLGRRLFHQYFNQNAVKNYGPIQTREVRRLLKRAAAATEKTQLLDARSLRQLPGAFWIEFFPWLKFLPSWVPGRTARRFAGHYSPTAHALRNKPFEEVVENMVRGNAGPSVTQSVVKKLRGIPRDTLYHREFEQSARDATAIAYVGQ
ncbi:hypothetical protein EIP86_011425 [Pleurotus ostreatoroseus]|nr:hypothetical protein EIP86_011425 [Pleurotus ostreatoroseus]